ncbi:MAG: twin-arginine translocase TatA/TatE family subunit [Acidobacteria bacterium]|nr:twin-arginine translocase TatA/TatE family subunit [Acidobacteriota bacterium]
MNLGLPELMAIFLVALLLFGPRKLPEIGKTLGRVMGEFKRATNDIKNTLEEEVEAEKAQERFQAEGEGAAVPGQGTPPPADPPGPDMGRNLGG